MIRRLLILSSSVAFANEFSTAFEGERVAVWGDYSEWSPCTNPCGDDGSRVRTRPCLHGRPGEGSCIGDQLQEEACSADCSAPCATNVYHLTAEPVAVTLLNAASEICFWSSSVDEANPAGNVLSYNGVTLARDAENFIVVIGAHRHFVPVNRAYSHTCILFMGNNVKIVQDGMEWGWYGGAVVGDTQMILGGGGFNGLIAELAASSTMQNEILRAAQSQGSACNMGELVDFSGADAFMVNDQAWSEWGSCSHNCNGGRSYRYRQVDSSVMIQMYRTCKEQPCADGWEDWSSWTPCAASCGAGESFRTRRCMGSRDACEGEPNEKQACAGLPCPQCGYSNWQFPEQQATTNYLMVKHVMPSMDSVSICFSVETGGSELHGTVFSYSKGLDSPRGNELLFLGKDVTNDEIRLYRRDHKLAIPNTVLSTDGPSHFCIVLQAQPNDKLFTSIYVNGLILNTSTEGLAKGGIAFPGGGEMIIGQDQDCLLGCFNASQAFIGNLDQFAIYDVALTPDEVLGMAEFGTCGDKKPILTLDRDSTLVYGNPSFRANWGEWTSWSECSTDCGFGRESRHRNCNGGKPNDTDCPGRGEESRNCSSDEPCSSDGEWTPCTVSCGGGGNRVRTVAGVDEVEACGDNSCQAYGEWSSWSECSVTCGEGFIYRARECYNGPCDEPTQETGWCDNGGVRGRCADPWNLPWPCGDIVHQSTSNIVRIVGGYESRRGEIPWICILEVRTDPICGASVIAPKWNIGASHCVSQTFDRPDQMRMLCGKHDRSRTEEGSQVGQIKQYYKHPKYSGSTIDYDLCLFEMKSAWRFTDYVKPVCLPGMHSFPQPGTMCKVAGWGSVEGVAPGQFIWNIEMARVLRAVHVPIIEQAQCAAKYKDQISRRMFCAGYTEGGRDACQGDSGGPVACQIGNNGRFQLTGVVSWGIGCAQKNLPGVYTKIAMLTDWIYDYIGQDAGRDPACNADPLLKFGPRGQFTSPMYDDGTPYGYNMNCHWVIQLRPLKGLLAVTFSKFDLQYSKDCREDSLALYDGENLDLYKGAWCGISGPGTLVASNTAAQLKFELRTNADNRGTMPTGFKALWARARLRTQRSAGCAMPIEDFTVEKELRSAQSFSWPLTPPPNSPVSCMIVLRAKKDRETKQIAFPTVWLDEVLDPWCAKKIGFYRQTRINPKYLLRDQKILEGEIYRHVKPIFMMSLDKNGGGQCRWKLHYTGCTKQDKKGECLLLKNQLEVPAQTSQRAGDQRASGQPNSERSCSLKGFKNHPEQIGNSHAARLNMPTSLVALNIPRPSPRPVKSGSKPFKRPGPRTRRATKRPYVKNTPAICSGSLVGNDKCFVTSEECGRIVQKSWNEKKQGMYTEVGGEQILTRNCVISPKSAHGASIAVCGLDAAVNPNTVVVPCYPAAEVQASEILLTESQTNLNNGLKADKTEITWLPTHPTIDGSTSAVKGFKFETGFVGSGKSLCNVETGIPIYRDTADGSRELMGINIKTKADHGCSDSLSFASITRHGSWIAAQCAQFADADSVKFEVLPKNEATCSTDKVITFNNACTPVDVTSPGYPSLYENDQICSWKLIAPKGHQIVVTFLDVDIERSNHKRKCNHDALLWKVGNEKTDVEVCSSQDHRARYVSPKESASLEFRTDSSFKGRGFRARVSCQKRG